MKKLTLFVSICLLAIGLSAEEIPVSKEPVGHSTAGTGPVANVQPVVQVPTVESALRNEIAYLRMLVKKMEVQAKYDKIVCAQPDTLKAEQDLIEAAQKMQAAQVPKETPK